MSILRSGTASETRPSPKICYVENSVMDFFVHHQKFRNTQNFREYSNFRIRISNELNSRPSHSKHRKNKTREILDSGGQNMLLGKENKDFYSITFNFTISVSGSFLSYTIFFGWNKYFRPIYFRVFFNYLN